MPGFSDTFETELLQHIFQNAAIPNLGDAGGLLPSSSAGSVYLALHTADPGEAGTQSTNETTYSGYARVAVVRSAGGWAVTGPTAQNVGSVSFPQCVGGSATVTHISVGYASSGANTIVCSGALTASLIINPGITPLFAAGAFNFTVD